MKDIELKKDGGEENNIENKEDAKECNPNLNSFVFWKNIQDRTKDFIFKNKLTKTYIQVKTKNLNEGKYSLIILNDITRIKKLEKDMKKLRSLYFS